MINRHIFRVWLFNLCSGWMQKKSNSFRSVNLFGWFTAKNWFNSFTNQTSLSFPWIPVLQCDIVLYQDCMYHKYCPSLFVLT